MTGAPALPATLDDLERRHDGPAPEGAVAVVLLGGRARADELRRAAALHHHERQSAAARDAAARRRAQLGAGDILDDDWLRRLGATLAHHRHAALGA